MVSWVAPPTLGFRGLIKQLVDRMTAKDPQARIDDLGLKACTGVRLLAELLAERTMEGPPSVLDALAGIRTPIDLGSVPLYPGVQDPPPEPDYPRVAVFGVIEARVEGGTLVQQGDFFNPLKS